MARALAVELVGDSRSLERAFSRSSRSAKQFNSEIGRLGRGGVAASGLFRGLGRSVAFASGAFLGGFGLVTAVRSAFEEMSHAQQVAAQTSAAIKSTGGVAGVTAKHVEELGVQLLNLSGVNDETIKSSENLLLAFTNIRNVGTGKNAIFDRATLAALDVSIRKNKDLSGVSVQLGKALQDPVRGLTALRRVGITFTAAQEKTIKSLVESGHLLEAQKLILDSVEQKYGGAAKAAGDTLGGKLNILKENILNVEGAIATLLLPAITKVVDQLVAWVQNTDNQKRVLNDAKQVIETVSGVLDTLKGALDGVNRITGSTAETLKILFGALVAFKTLGLVARFQAYVTQIGLIGSSATVATGEVTALRGALVGLATLGVVTVAVEVLLHKKEIVEKAKDIGIPFADKSGLDLIRMAFPNAVGPRWLQQKLGLDEKAKGIGADAAKAVARAQKTVVDAIKKVTDKPGFAELPGDVPKVPKVDPKFRRAANEAFRQRQIDLLGLGVDRAGLTKTLSDDLAANRRLNALLKKRIAGGHDTIALEQQQIGVEKTIADLLQQQAELRKAARDARQFRFLGLGPGGEELAPKVKGLKRELGSVEGLVSGTFLDTKKTRSMISRIRQLLSGALGALSAEVRTKIRQMLDDLQNQIKNRSVDQTKFHKVAPGILGALGLNDKQRKVLSRILPQLGPGGVLPTPSGQFAAGGVPIVIQIDGKTVAKVTVKHNEDALGHRKKGRAHSRRGTR